MKFIKLPISLLALPLLFAGNIAFAQNAYIKTDIIKVAGVTDTSQVDGLPAASKHTSYTYLNGLGTPTQQVAYQGSPNSNDVIQIYQYDQFGQKATNYLPYVDGNIPITFRATAVADQQNYYINNSTPGNLNKEANDPLPFSQKLFENSPLRRLVAVGKAGVGFQPDLQDNTQHFSVISYRNNTAADQVLIAPVTNGTTFYPANALSVTDAKDADGVEILVFKNSTGQTLLKRQVSGKSAEPFYDTYYVFNANGSTAYIIPPKAAHLIASGAASNIATAPLSNLIYAYTYDALGRVTTRKAPNTGLINVVYDAMNRPVLIQDGNKAASTVNQWYYIKYDTRNRPVSQGIYTDNTNIGQANMQAYVNANYGTNYYEARSPAAATWYYTNTCFPSQNIQQLAFAFYDDYDLTQVGSPRYSYQVQGLVNGSGSSIEAAPTAQTQGMLTMVLKRSVGSGLSNIWLSKVFFYDKHSNIIQVQSNNHLNFTQYAVTDYRTVAPDFIGKPLQTKATKVTGSGTANTNKVLTTYAYDTNNERVQSISQAYNSQAPVNIANYAYNELGQLVTKMLGQVGTGSGSTPATQSLNTTYSGTNTVTATSSITMLPGFSVPSGSTFTANIFSYLQTLDYRYNIRGQLLSINNSTLSNDGGLTNSDNTDLFGMSYVYEGTDASLPGASPSYSGRISAVKWSYKYNNGANTANERSYVYHYDRLGQLTDALYAERAPGSSAATPFTINRGGFDEAGISYDDEGNIQTLRRNYSANNGTGGTPLDNLNYTYDTTNPDRLYQVTDAVSQTGSYGFNNVAGATSSSFYQYDADGNLLADPYKGISMSYNLLNRTDVISAPGLNNSTINYTYGDAKTVLKKQVYNNGVLQATTDYIDEFMYTNGVISSLQMPEGRVVNVSGTLKAEYIITDQQGNARFSFRDDGSGSPVIIQENSYYGFGAVMPNSLVALSPSANNNYLYNGGSEWQNVFGNLPDYYQTGSRNYDPELGRFISVDPMAELSASLTNYHYAGNNPIRYKDPTGNSVEEDDNEDDGGDGSGGSGQAAPDEGKSADTETGGGGGGDPSTSYSGGSVPENTASSGGVYNNGGQNSDNGTNGGTSINTTLTQDGVVLQDISGAQNGGDHVGLNDVHALDEVTITGYTTNNTGAGGFDFGSVGSQLGNFGSFSLIGQPVGIPHGFSQWYDGLSKGNAVEGAGAWVATLSKVTKVARIGESASWAGVGVGIILDGTAYYKEEISGEKFLLNTGVGVAGALSSYIAPVSVFYFGVDAFYPGGWEGVGKDLSNFGNDVYEKTIQGFNQYNNNIRQWQ